MIFIIAKSSKPGQLAPDNAVQAAPGAQTSAKQDAQTDRCFMGTGEPRGHAHVGTRHRGIRDMALLQSPPILTAFKFAMNSVLNPGGSGGGKGLTLVGDESRIACEDHEDNANPTAHVFHQGVHQLSPRW